MCPLPGQFDIRNAFPPPKRKPRKPRPTTFRFTGPTTSVHDTVTDPYSNSDEDEYLRDADPNYSRPSVQNPPSGYMMWSYGSMNEPYGTQPQQYQRLVRTDFDTNPTVREFKRRAWAGDIEGVQAMRSTLMQDYPHMEDDIDRWIRNTSVYQKINQKRNAQPQMLKQNAYHRAIIKLSQARLAINYVLRNRNGKKRNHSVITG